MTEENKRLEKRLELYGLKPVITKGQKRALAAAIAEAGQYALAHNRRLEDIERDARDNKCTVQDQIQVDDTSAITRATEFYQEAMERSRARALQAAATAALQLATERASAAYQRTYTETYNEVFRAEFSRGLGFELEACGDGEAKLRLVRRAR